MKMKDSKKPIILLVGPLAPPGGIGVAVEMLLNFSLKEEFGLTYVNNFN